MSRRSKENDLSTAENFLRNEAGAGHISPTIIHYHVSETNDVITQFTGVRITDSEAAELVQKLRDENGLGPIAAYNLPDSQ